MHFLASAGNKSGGVLWENFSLQLFFFFWGGGHNKDYILCHKNLFLGAKAPLGIASVRKEVSKEGSKEVRKEGSMFTQKFETVISG